MPTALLFILPTLQPMTLLISGLWVCNVVGEKIYSTLLTGNRQTISNQFPSGLYIVKISGGEKQLISKLIVQ
jgi:hypothetical protein